MTITHIGIVVLLFCNLSNILVLYFQILKLLKLPILLHQNNAKNNFFKTVGTYSIFMKNVNISMILQQLFDVNFKSLALLFFNL